ncbi:MAG: hypothetical protein IMF05_02810 [Proteobacteria bacterium]|nr:hypothetical protein [Pseudomonadota bacterium]
MSYSIAFKETARGLFATWRMFLRDPRAASLFENSHAGALRSYWAAVVILPVYMLVTSIEYAVPSESYANFGRLVEHSGLLSATLAEFCVYTLCWFVAWPLVVDRIAPYLDCGQNFFRYVAAYNWMHVPYVLIGLLFWIGKMSGVIHDGNNFAATLTLLGVIWTYHWFVLRHALGLNGGYAALLVGLEFVFITMLKEMILSTAM